MEQAQFLTADGALAPPEPPLLGGWLPSLQQMSNAVQFRLSQAVGPDPAHGVFQPGVHSSMREGVGMLFLVGFLAGLLDFFVNWISAARLGTNVPLAQLSTGVGRWAALPNTSSTAEMTAAAETLAGLGTRAPGWVAAGLSALGEWISLPLQLMTIWIILGLFVLLTAKLLGAVQGLTLQRFYAATAYAFLPLVLTMLAPLACLGPVLGVIAWAWAFLLYVATVRFAADLDIGRTLIAIFAPLALLLLAGLVLVSVGFGVGAFLIF